MNKTIKLLSSVVLVILFMISFASFAHAPGYANEAELPAVKVAMSDDQSIIIDRILYEGIKRAGFQMVAQVTGMRTAVADVNYGDAAVLPLQTDGWDLLYENLIRVPVIISHVEFIAYTRSGDNFRFSNWGDMAGLRLGYRLQNAYVANNAWRADAEELVEVNSLEELWNTLLSYETDVIVIPCAENYEHRFPRGVKRVGVIEQLPCYTYVNNKYAHLVPLLEKAYKEMIDDGTAAMIKSSQKRTGANDNPIVLHINSYNEHVEWERSQIESIRGYVESDSPIEYRSISLNSNEYRSQASYNSIVSDLIRTDFVARYPDLVITSGNEALDFVLNNYYLLFPNVPVVFYGAQGVDDSMLYGYGEFFSGISKTDSFLETVSEMLRLYPETSRVFILNDHNSSRSQAMSEEMHKSMPLLSSSVEVMFSENKPFGEILMDIRGFGPETLVLIGSYISDAGGSLYSESDVQRMVVAASGNPVFCLTTSYLGHGTVGGLLSGTDEYNRAVAAMISELLSGASPSAVTTVYDSASMNEWQFDYMVVGEFKIETASLPPGHTMINRSIPIWESNPSEFWLALAVGILLLLIIGGLIVSAKMLAGKQAAAVSASMAKSAFLATMSHEIRTPMNAILGITEIQLQKEELDEDIREALNKTSASGYMLLGIINDILDLSKIEAGKLEIVNDKYEIASLISDAAQLNIMRIGSKPVEFRLEIDENIPASLSGDVLRVKQVLNNILSNAFKYTSSGMVRLSVTTEHFGDDDKNVTLVFCISDTGQGMSKEQIGKLFDQYARFNIEANRTTEGTGLGMSITKNLLRLMNGEISIMSEPGEGTRVTMSIPQKRVGPDALGKEAAENLQNFRISSRVQMKRVQLTREPMPYGSVLIVDDVETNIYVAKGLLAPYELALDSAESGFEAIEKVRSGKVYDIVFMDHMMPKMDGIEATKILRELNYEHPIVALTANAVAGQADIFLGNGFDDFISKPIDIRQLNTILNKLVRDKQPPEVLEAARNKAGAAKEQPLGSGAQRYLNPQFAEVFARDARKSLAVLDGLFEKGDIANDENDLRTYTIYAHGMKSALANIGKMELSAVALKLEVSARGGDIDTIMAETPAFLDALRRFVEDISPESKPESAEAGEYDIPLLREKLLAIKTACEEFDEESIEKVLAELRAAPLSQQTRDLLGVIDEHLLHSEFEEIAESIASAI